MTGNRVVSYAACDYLRITYTRPDAEDVASGAYGGAVAYLADRYGLLASDTRPWAWRGYAGIQAGQAAWGLRDDGAILQVSGAAAGDAALLDLPYTGVPRLDIQVTTWGEASPDAIPRAVACASAAAARGVSHRPWRVRLVDGYGAGDTAYLGSRSSAWFVRVYDKERESGEAQYTGAVRYEVEAHDEEAAALYSRLGKLEWDFEAVQAAVAGYVGLRGYDLGGALQAVALEPERRPREATPTERTLTWLGEGVAPTIARLLGAGLTRAQLEGILGLA